VATAVSPLPSSLVIISGSGSDDAGACGRRPCAACRVESMVGLTTLTSPTVLCCMAGVVPEAASPEAAPSAGVAAASAGGAVVSD
jgi:hypothetical protein